MHCCFKTNNNGSAKCLSYKMSVIVFYSIGGVIKNGIHFGKCYLNRLQGHKRHHNAKQLFFKLMVKYHFNSFFFHFIHFLSERTKMHAFIQIKAHVSTLCIIF